MKKLIQVVFCLIILFSLTMYTASAVAEITVLDSPLPPGPPFNSPVGPAGPFESPLGPAGPFESPLGPVGPPFEPPLGPVGPPFVSPPPHGPG